MKNLISNKKKMKKPNLLRVHVNVTMCDLKDKINGCLNYRNTRMIISVEYYCPSIGYRRMSLVHPNETTDRRQCEEDIKTMISVEYHCFI